MSQTAELRSAENADLESEIATCVAEASVMLDLFEGLGVRSFALTIIDEAGRKVAFRPPRTASTLRSELPSLLPRCSESRLNVIVRPSAVLGLSLVQLDDLASSQLDRVHAFSFLVLETSPANFQAWLAVKGASHETMRRIKKAAGADLNASGATRLAGSHNFKQKYAPCYPRIRLQAVAPKHIVTIEELDRAGLLVSEEPPAHASKVAGHPRPPRTAHRHLVWPSYARCLVDAPPAKNHEGKDRSAADFHFCLISIDRGWSVEETAKKLMAESEKARSTGYRYAVFTARRAEAMVPTNGD